MVFSIFVAGFRSLLFRKRILRCLPECRRNFLHLNGRSCSQLGSDAVFRDSGAGCIGQRSTGAFTQGANSQFIMIRNQHHLEARKLLQYVCASKYAKARDYVFLGRSYVDELGDTSSSNETARLLKKALQMEPSVQGYKERAKLFEMMGKPEMARKDLDAAKDLSGSPF